MTDRQVKARNIAYQLIADDTANTMEGAAVETPEGVLDVVYTEDDGSVHAVIVRHYVYGQAGPKIDQAEIETARKAATWMFAGLHAGDHVFVDSVVICWQHAGQYALDWVKGIWRI